MNMRDATPEERDAVLKYLAKISKSTGVDFFECLEEDYEPSRASQNKREDEETREGTGV